MWRKLFDREFLGERLQSGRFPRREFSRREVSSSSFLGGKSLGGNFPRTDFSKGSLALPSLSKILRG